MKEGRVPLVVGLDGTITKANTFFELVVCFLKSKWSNLFVLLALLGKDQAVIKTALAERVSLEVASLPMNREVLAEIDKARKNKRQTVLATASSLTVANQISDIWGPFDFVLGSTPGDNMKAGREAEVLTELYGEKGFDYIGSGYSDIPALSRARASFLVTPSRLLLRKSRNGGIAVRVLGGKEPTGQAFVRALRPYQWVKNLLLLAPALAAHVSALDAALPLLWAFLSFSLVASSVYLANDLWDLESDRNHPVKKKSTLSKWGSLATTWGTDVNNSWGVRCRSISGNAGGGFHPCASCLFGHYHGLLVVFQESAFDRRIYAGSSVWNPYCRWGNRSRCDSEQLVGCLQLLCVLVFSPS